MKILNNSNITAPLTINPTNTSGIQDGLILTDVGSGSSEGLIIGWRNGDSGATNLGQIHLSSGTVGNGGNLIFSTNAGSTSAISERLRITSGGSVGIGTSSPTNKLEVSGSASFSGIITSTVAQGTAPFIVGSSTLISNLNAELLSGQTTGYYLNYNNLNNKPTINDATITLTASGLGLSGSATFSLNQSGATTFTVTSNATYGNTASTIVARDSGGNFTAGTITAGTFSGTLSGNITGNAATVTNGLYSTGAYSNPSWLTGLSWSKILGTPTTLSGYGITDALNSNNATLTRINTTSEGGQINFNRPFDDTMYWALDTYGSSTAPSFRLLETTNNRFQIDPGGVVFFNGSAGSSGQILTSQGTTTAPIWKTFSGSGSGTVTNVAMTVPSYLTVTGSPITSSGTFAISANNQNANTILAGPATGTATTPSFRSLVIADIPNLGVSYLSLSGGTLTGQLVISSGGASITGGVTSLSDIYVNGLNIGAGPSTNAFNTKVGYQALSGISIGTYNVAIGYQALFGTTNASNNVAIGRQALYSTGNTSSGLIAIGYSALYSNGSGTQNIAIGNSALYYNASGYSNIAIGYNAGINLVSGSDNMALGTSALINNYNGSYNCALGSNAFFNASGSQNVGIGSFVGYNVTTGSSNTIIGGLRGTSTLSDTVLIGAGTAERLKVDSTGLYVNQSTNNLNDALAIAWLGL